MASTQNQQPKLTYQRRRQSVQFFVELLQDDLGIEMMLIPAGTFTMGSPEDEIDRSSSESPQHEVSVPTFFMDKYPITQAQWRFVAELPQVNRELKLDPSRFKGDKRPAERVSWYEAVEFCDRLSTYTGREYRLPTEAEWEYACRAGMTTPFHFGETITTDLTNYRGTDDKQLNRSGSYGRGPKGEYREETTSVDHFGIANTFGLCGMHGNVWEWCQDHWHDSYTVVSSSPQYLSLGISGYTSNDLRQAPIDGSAWVTENENANRVVRGGSWRSFPAYCRSAFRDGSSPDFREYTFGFRVVCVAPRTL